MDVKVALKEEILALVREYYLVAHQRPAFIPGKTRIPYSGRVYDDREMALLADASLDFWLTAGPYADRFERQFQRCGPRGDADAVAGSAIASERLLECLNIRT